MASNNFDIPWFYEEIIDINNDIKFEFNKENIHYCKKVLRINKNSKILIFDGFGNIKTANINLNGKDTFVYACKNLTKAEATKDIKSRFKPYKVTKVKPA